MARASPAATPTLATTPRRQSCDRCHGQKLRCTRAGNRDTGACNRCLRHGSQCVYSASLPKGRPSMYRFAEAYTAPSTRPAGPPAPTTPELCHRHPTSPRPASANVSADASPNKSGSRNTDRDINRDNILAGLAQSSMPMPVLTPASTSSSSWSWPASINWNEMQIDRSEQDQSQPASNLHMTFGAQIEGGAAFLDAPPTNILNWTSTQNGDIEGYAQNAPLSPTSLHEHGHGLGNDALDNSSRSSSISMDKTRPDVGIAQLSQLSTHLNVLHRSSCTLAEAARSPCPSRSNIHAHQSPLISDAAFKSVAAWLLHISADTDLVVCPDFPHPTTDPKNTSDTLHDVFSASHQLLEILRCLHADTVPRTPHSASTVLSSAARTHLDFWSSINPEATQPRPAHNNITASSYEWTKGLSGGTHRSSQYSSTVVRHLVIACYTLLLNIYVEVLIALQRGADLRSYCLSDIDSDTAADAAPLADIRLVLVAQLCAYLLERQQQAVDAYLSPQSSSVSSSSQNHTPSGSHQPSPPASTYAGREAMSSLEMEVQQRLVQLRRTLRI